MKLLVNELKEYLNSIEFKDDAVVKIEVIEDFYFKENNWEKERKEVRLVDGNSLLSEHDYVIAFCNCRYSDSEDLYINAHY